MKVREILTRIFKLVTRKNLHRLVTLAGVAFATYASFELLYNGLGMSVSGRVGALIGILTTLAAGWKRARPTIDAAIDTLPIPEDEVPEPIPVANGAVSPVNPGQADAITKAETPTAIAKDRGSS